MESTPTPSPQVGESQSEADIKPPSAQKSNQPAAHKRTYQACLPCRRRKVKCDLGSVDAPADPPCLRCRREKKECIFSETRRKRKPDDDTSLQDGADESPKRFAFPADGAHNGFVGDIRVPHGLPVPIDDGGMIVDGMRRTGGNRSIKNEVAAEMLHDPIFGPNDALRVLVDAASKTEADDQAVARRVSEGGANFFPREPLKRRSGTIQPDEMAHAIDPAIVGGPSDLDPQHYQDWQDAVHAWRGVRFVRAGWFTPEEGIAYVKYFYSDLSPLSPVVPPDFSALNSQARLLSEEPMLTVTILAIASRYMELKGSGGKSRTFWMHDRLWDYLQKMITRMFWGQEQYGGGFCGAGNLRTEEAEAQRRGLRSLGTIESLLLLTDWLPRSMHFPPGDDGDEVWIPADGPINPHDPVRLRGIHLGWTEPAIRSDRMCWSLVGMAYSLAFELGVFDSLIENGKWVVGPRERTIYDPERADRAGRMLFVYVTQACGRLGYPNMMPHEGTELGSEFLKMEIPAGSYEGPYGQVTTTDKIQRAWAELTALIRRSNTELFESKARTQESIRTGNYIQYIQKYQPRLQNWKERFEQTEIPPKARTMLLMEFHYARTYINSLSLQAVLEHIKGGGDNADNEEPNQAHTPPGLLSSKVVDFKKQNEPYIKEMVDASRSILELAVKDLRSDSALRLVPVRTHFRILSGAMFLLKSFALGGKENEVAKSLNLLQEAIKALGIFVPDDTHLSLRIAELLSSLTTSFRTKFVRLAKPPHKRTSAQGRPSTSHTSAPNAQGSSNPGGISQTAASANEGHRRDNFNNPRDFYNIFGPIPVVDPNDPNITIMPPSDFLGQNATYDPSAFGPNSPHSATGGVYSPTTHQAAINGNSPTGAGGSPTITSNTMRARHGSQSMPFSPTQASVTSTGPGNSFSPTTYDWLAVDFNPLLNAQSNSMRATPSSGPAQLQTSNSNGMLATTGSTSGNSNGPEGGNAFGGNVGPWNGGAFGPEISEGIELLSALGASDNLEWANSTGSNAGGGWTWGA